ncbi:hypothetical protein [Thalassotalea marina]|uniref:Uncharacterized protein n=1 Tax=Thalassotalea marina TaxID=1673741 RepID=A0A919BLT9_9GAMM|nr:hypothetical protein [Thalassotalea marina]GHF96033.1 hypothetical protein GCM10017161_25450 [Thalassotalea marina]
MNKARRMSHATQRRRLMARHKLKIHGRRLNHFIQENQDQNANHASSLS